MAGQAERGKTGWRQTAIYLPRLTGGGADRRSGGKPGGGMSAAHSAPFDRRWALAGGGVQCPAGKPGSKKTGFPFAA
jgi:hypothetical protein